MPPGTPEIVPVGPEAAAARPECSNGSPISPVVQSTTPMTGTDRGLLPEVEQILQSEAFRNAEGLRRLLRFLAEKTAAGEADQLKEYTIGVDGLGKPATYDTHHDAAVRIQVGRLRQKLADYYSNEGRDDAFRVELPKGRFKLTCERRAAPPQAPSIGRWRTAAIV